MSLGRRQKKHCVVDLTRDGVLNDLPGERESGERTKQAREVSVL